MHRELGEMLIYTIIIVLLQTRETTSELFEKRLSREVINYRKFIDSNLLVGVPVSEDAATAEEWIRPEVFQSLEYNMRFVMKLLSDFYQWTLLSEEDAAALAREERKLIMVRRTVLEPRNLIESVACSLFPRLLAFLYIGTNDHVAYVRLHRLHRALCVAMPKMKTKNRRFAGVQGRSTYMCDINTVTLLHDVKQEFANPIVSTETDWLNGTLFVTNVHNCVKGVDKKRMLTAMARWKQGQRNVFGVPEGDFFRRRRTTEKKEAGKEHGELNEKLRRLTYQYHANLSTAAAEEEDEEASSVPDAVNRTMTRAFRTLVGRFGRAVRGLSDDDGDDDWTNGRSTVVRTLDAVTDGQCKRVPLVLVYLADNCSDAADTAALFALYLTLCSDWTAYLDAHCPKGPDRFDEFGCLKDATENRLLVNFYAATGEFLDYGNDDDDDDDDSDDDENTNAFLAFDYIKTVLKIVKGYYAGPELDDLPVWTASGWLTGNHFLAYRGENPGNPTSALAKRTIALPGNAQEVMLLSEAHDLLLPWNSDARNVFAFHAVLFEQANQLLDDFVYQHAAVIVLYLQHVADHAESTPSSRLSDTIGWYAGCARKFSEELPGPHEPRGERTVDAVVSAIASIDKNATKESPSGENAKIRQTVPPEKQTELSAWSKRHFPDTKELKYLEKLNLMLHKICQNAVMFVNTFDTFVQTSMTMTDYDKFLVFKHCEQFVADVFVKTAVPPNYLMFFE